MKYLLIFALLAPCHAKSDDTKAKVSYEKLLKKMQASIVERDECINDILPVVPSGDPDFDALETQRYNDDLRFCLTK